MDAQELLAHLRITLKMATEGQLRLGATRTESTELQFFQVFLSILLFFLF